jgi:hypothetical protein
LIEHRRGNIPEPPQPHPRRPQPTPGKTKTPPLLRRSQPEQEDAKVLQKAPAPKPPQLLDGDGANTIEAGKEREDQNPQRSHRHRHTDCAWEPNADKFLGLATNDAEMGLELRQLYWPRRRRRHQNDAAQPTYSTPIYTPRTRNRGSLPLPPPERQKERRGTEALGGEEW